MMMEKMKKCRICLLENVRMYVVADKNLQEIYEKLTDVPFVTEDSRPTLACVFCCSKLKQCYQLQRKCLEAEELFTQMLNEDYEPNTLINRDHLESFSGFIKTPTENISIDDECQTVRVAIKEELPAVCEGLDDIIELKEKPQSDELEPENFDNSCLDVADIRPHYSESDLEDDVPLMDFKIEVEEEQESTAVCEGLDYIIEPKEEHQRDELEPENFDNSCLDVADIPPNDSESDLEDDVPLMEFKIEVDEEQELSKSKRRARETTRATVAKKLKLDTRRPKLEDAKTARKTKKERSDSKVIRTKRTSKPAAYFKEPYKCDQRAFRPKGILIKHIRKQTGEKPYKCDVCPRSFSVKCSLLRHIRIHTGDTPYKCDLCQRSFTDQSVLINHNRIHTGEKPFKCDICQSSFRQSGHLTEHIRIHTGEKPHKCDECQRTFSNKSHLTDHIRIHTGEKPYKCDVCQSSFSYKRNLTQHIRIHTSEKPYKCDVCQVRFSEQGHLSEHIRIHTDERPYKCDVCQRSFSHKNNLTKHIRIHEKPYKCDVCQRSFSSKSDITKHIRIHTGEKPFKCDKCERSFRQFCHLKRHNLIHTC